MGKALKAEPAFKQMLWAVLEKSLDTSRAPRVLWYQGYVFRVATAFVLAAVVVGATGAYAYASPTVTEGTVLYPVKKTLEKVGEKLQVTPEKKAVFLLKQIDRREAEKKVLETKHQPIQNIETAIGSTEQKLETASAALKATPKKNPALLKKVEKRLTERQERLEKAKRELEKRLEKREERDEDDSEGKEEKKREESGVIEQLGEKLLQDKPVESREQKKDLEDVVQESVEERLMDRLR